MAGTQIMRRRWAVTALALAVFLLTAGCSAPARRPAAAGVPAVATPPPPQSPPPQQQPPRPPRLTPAQLAGQRVIYSYRGHTPPASLLSLISRGEAAGVIFFAGNVGTTAQFAAAIRRLDRAAASKLNPVHLPLLLMTDQEGGTVRRLPGAPLLSARQIGAATGPVTAASQEGSAAAANLRAHGLDVNLAPVLDVYRQQGNFIDQYGRSFSDDPAQVARLGTAFATAQQQGGVASAVKHFPGLGAAAQPDDTDLRPVSLPLSAPAIRGVDEVPYQSAIAAKVRLVMVSWAVYPALDRTRPAGLSATIVQGELRRRLGFTGVTITDALEAGALRPFGSIARRAVLAASAGMDLLLCSAGSVTEGKSALTALQDGYQHGSLAKADFSAADERILALRTWLAAADKR